MSGHTHSLQGDDRQKKSFSAQMSPVFGYPRDANSPKKTSKPFPTTPTSGKRTGTGGGTRPLAPSQRTNIDTLMTDSPSYYDTFIPASNSETLQVSEIESMYLSTLSPYHADSLHRRAFSVSRRPAHKSPNMSPFYSKTPGTDQSSSKSLLQKAAWVTPQSSTRLPSSPWMETRRIRHAGGPASPPTPGWEEERKTEGSQSLSRSRSFKSYFLSPRHRRTASAPGSEKHAYSPLPAVPSSQPLHGETLGSEQELTTVLQQGTKAVQRRQMSPAPHCRPWIQGAPTRPQRMDLHRSPPTTLMPALIPDVRPNPVPPPSNTAADVSMSPPSLLSSVSTTGSELQDTPSPHVKSNELREKLDRLQLELQAEMEQHLLTTPILPVGVSSNDTLRSRHKTFSRPYIPASYANALPPLQSVTAERRPHIYHTDQLYSADALQGECPVLCKNSSDERDRI